ncbi:MAG: hypothetical protein WDO24_16690 [Pseudomonadota bacterium]
MSEQGQIAPQPQPSPSRIGEALRRNALAFGALAVLAALGGVQATGGSLSRMVAAGSDHIGNDQLIARAAAFATMRPVKLKPVPAPEVGTALDKMALPPQQRQLLASDLQTDRVRLAVIELFDSDAEDGDAVTISSLGFSLSATLTKAPLVVSVPIGSSGTISLTGLVDGGGGGVTVGMITPSGPVPLPVLSPGQTISVPVGIP